MYTVIVTTTKAKPYRLRRVHGVHQCRFEMVCYDSMDSIVTPRGATVVIGVCFAGSPPSIPVEGVGEAGLSVLRRVDIADEAPESSLVGIEFFCK